MEQEQLQTVYDSLASSGVGQEVREQSKKVPLMK
jgi:hypothetical protein